MNIQCISVTGVTQWGMRLSHTGGAPTLYTLSSEQELLYESYKT